MYCSPGYSVLTHGARNFFCPRSTLLAIMYSTEYRYEMPVYVDKTTMKRSNKRVINLVRGLVRALNTLTYGLSYIMRYIFLVIFSINCTRLRLVQLIEKMTRKIYLIMYSRPYVNAYLMGTLGLTICNIIFPKHKHSTLMRFYLDLTKLYKFSVKSKLFLHR